MNKGAATHTRILDVAARQASVRGLSAISLSDVAEAAGLSKSGLFRHFDSKEAMQLETLAATYDRFMDFVWAPGRPLPRGRARLESVFERWLDWGDIEWAEGGCLLRAASVELDGQPGPLRDLLQERIRIWTRMLTREMQALTDPALAEDVARQAVFQMKSFILGHGESRRLLEERGSRAAARAAFDALLDRTAAA